jgi:cysteine-rich repeat protein
MRRSFVRPLLGIVILAIFIGILLWLQHVQPQKLTGSVGQCPCSDAPTSGNTVVPTPTCPGAGNYCVGNTSCMICNQSSSSLGNAPGQCPAAGCNDNNPCTTDSCDQNTHACVFKNNTDQCNDNNQCTVSDVCSNGTCQGGIASGIDCTVNAIAGKCDATGSCKVNTCLQQHPDLSLCIDITGGGTGYSCGKAKDCCLASGELNSVTPTCRTGLDCVNNVCTCTPRLAVCCEGLLCPAGGSDVACNMKDPKMIAKLTDRQIGESCGGLTCIYCYDDPADSVTACASALSPNCVSCAEGDKRPSCICNTPSSLKDSSCSAKYCDSANTDPGCQTHCTAYDQTNCYTTNDGGKRIVRGYFVGDLSCVDRISGPGGEVCSTKGGGGIVPADGGNADTTVNGTSPTGNNSGGNNGGNAGNAGTAGTAGTTGTAGTAGTAGTNGTTGGTGGGSTASTGNTGNTGSTGSTGSVGSSTPSSQASGGSQSSTKSTGTSTGSTGSSGLNKSSGSTGSNGSSGSTGSSGSSGSNSSQTTCTPYEHSCLQCITRSVCVSCNFLVDPYCTQTCTQYISLSNYPDGSSCTPCTFTQLIQQNICPAITGSSASSVSSGNGSSGSSKSASSSSASSKSSGSSVSSIFSSSSQSSKSSMSSASSQSSLSSGFSVSSGSSNSSRSSSSSSSSLSHASSVFSSVFSSTSSRFSSSFSSSRLSSSSSRSSVFSSAVSQFSSSQNSFSFSRPSSSSFSSAFSRSSTSSTSSSIIIIVFLPSSSDSSSSSFSVTTAICGNGRREQGEECDDGNRNGTQTSPCDTQCHLINATCGDGVIEQRLGEQCEPSVPVSDPRFSCTSSCHLIVNTSSHSSSSAVVGGVCNGTECANGGDAFCTAQQSICVTGAFPCVRCIPENSSTPLLPAAHSQSSESMSSIAKTSASTQSVSSSSAPVTVFVFASCGNGRIDPGELCDDGAGNSLNPNAACRPDCTPGRCGDGIIDTPLETCDDGARNGQQNDSCSTLCRKTYTISQVLPGTILQLPFVPSPTQSTQTSSNPLTASVITAPSTPTPPSNASSGPETLVLMAAGASAGYAWMRRKRVS